MARSTLGRIAATLHGLGTHYDVSGLTAVPLALAGGVRAFVPGSARQIFWLTLLPQLVLWPAFTVVAGLAGGLAALPFTSRRGAKPRTPAAGV